MKGKNICIISLGCPKNLVDTEHLLFRIKALGFEVENDPSKAQKVLINTCAFIKDAVQETIEVILEVFNLRKGIWPDGIVVYGCMVQRYGKVLKRLLPEVDAWFGVGQVEEVISFLQGERPDGLRLKVPVPLSYLGQRILCTPPYMAYLKVSEGCDNSCTFCMIPKIRGRLRSYPIKAIVEEAKRLLGEKELKEIILVAQDLTQYGKDLGMKAGLIRLLEELLKLEGPPWIRLMYLNPWGIEGDLISIVENEARICPYLDVPIQHIDSSILTLMGRNFGDGLIDKLNLLKSTRREIAIRTTLMLGFPTETEEQFASLCEFVKSYQFHHIGAFVFSPEKGTKAERIGPKVKDRVARSRLKRLMGLQAEISKALNERLIGQEMMVLIEGVHPETEHLLVGRTSKMAPEIDGQVIINKGSSRPGDFRKVRITEAYEYDLIGEIIE